VGGAAVSDKHTNFILNSRRDRSRHRALIQRVRSTVEKTSGLRLELEVRVMGERHDRPPGNRRRVENRLARLKLPRSVLSWRKRLRLALFRRSLPRAHGTLTGLTALLDQPVRKLVVGTFQRVTSIRSRPPVAEDLDHGSLGRPRAFAGARKPRLGRPRERGRAWPDTLIVSVRASNAARWG
jgi:hypothetical protein